MDLPRINIEGDGGQSKLSDIYRIHHALGGDLELLAMDDVYDNFTEEDFGKFLDNLQKSRKLPLGIWVHPKHPGFREEYLARHPEKTDVSSNGMAHIVGINSYDPATKTVEVYNSWNGVQKMSLKKFYAATNLR